MTCPTSDAFASRANEKPLSWLASLATLRDCGRWRAVRAIAETMKARGAASPADEKLIDDALAWAAWAEAHEAEHGARSLLVGDHPVNRWVEEQMAAIDASRRPFASAA